MHMNLNEIIVKYIFYFPQKEYGQVTKPEAGSLS